MYWLKLGRHTGNFIKHVFSKCIGARVKLGNLYRQQPPSWNWLVLLLCSCPVQLLRSHCGVSTFTPLWV